MDQKICRLRLTGARLDCTSDRPFSRWLVESSTRSQPTHSRASTWFLNSSFSVSELSTFDFNSLMYKIASPNNEALSIFDTLGTTARNA
ncbi:hypothetical protein HanHA89_Chr17g0688901 [Helianthus annuus]|nr:hypothetical protein HanHA89_Chr17g0688901 [Helianthus annuus]